MPKLDLNPHALSSSSSEQNAPSHSSPSYSSSICWRAGGTSKIQKRGSKHYDLTMESLQNFNQNINAADDERRSLYYLGLAASSSLLRQKLARSPGRESNYTAETSTSISTLLHKLQEWSSSCFKPGGTTNAIVEAAVKSASTPPMMAKVKAMTDKKRVDKISVANLNGSSTGAYLIDRSELAAARQSTHVLVAKSQKAVENPKFVWADKYQPKVLNDFICQREKSKSLENLINSQKRNGKSSHYILEGPPGVGKRTMALAVLRESFKTNELNTRDEVKEFKLEGGPIPSIKIDVKESSRHIEINVSEIRWHAAQVVMKLVKETNSEFLNQEEKECGDKKDRAIILHEAQKLPVDAQLNIRSFLESYGGCYTFFFCCSDVFQLKHLQTLCTVIHLLPPSNQEIVETLQFIANQESVQLPHHFAENVAEKSNHNLRQAIRSFEATWQSNYPFKEDQMIVTGWEEDISRIAKDIIDKQCPRQLYKIRKKLIILVEHSISLDFIIKTLVSELMRNLNENFQCIVADLCEEFNIHKGCFSEGENLINANEAVGKRMDDPARKSTLLFMTIEEFIAKFMSIYKGSSHSEEKGQEERHFQQF